MTRFRQAQQNAKRRDALLGAALIATSGAILAAPFALAWFYPVQFARFIWGF